MCIWNWIWLEGFHLDSKIVILMLRQQECSPHVMKHPERSFTSTLSTISSGVCSFAASSASQQIVQQPVEFCTPISWRISCCTESTKSYKYSSANSGRVQEIQVRNANWLSIYYILSSSINTEWLHKPATDIATYYDRPLMVIYSPKSVQIKYLNT